MLNKTAINAVLDGDVKLVNELIGELNDEDIAQLKVLIECVSEWRERSNDVLADALSMIEQALPPENGSN